MKRLLITIVCLLLVMSLCACSTSEGEAYTVSKNGTDYVIDPANGTISDGTHTYQYSISGSSTCYTINITYPDGSTYWWRIQSSGNFVTGSGGWSDDYDENRYVDGDTLCDILEVDVPKGKDQKDPKNVGLILLLLVIGIFNTASPRTAWYLEYGWRYKNADPSDLALGLNRLGGIIAIIAAVIIILI